MLIYADIYKLFPTQNKVNTGILEQLSVKVSV